MLFQESRVSWKQILEGEVEVFFFIKKFNLYLAPLKL